MELHFYPREFATKSAHAMAEARVDYETVSIDPKFMGIAPIGSSSKSFEAAGAKSERSRSGRNSI